MGWQKTASALTGATLIVMTGWRVAHQPGAIANELQIAQMLAGFGLILHSRNIRKPHK
jgi:hypothetical protein